MYLASTHDKISLLKPCYLYSEAEIKACRIFFCKLLREAELGLHVSHPLCPAPSPAALEAD